MLRKINNHPASASLSVLGVKSVSFRHADGRWTGVVYHECGVEFDVRQEGRRWNVNDDEGRSYRSRSLTRAIRKAVTHNAR